MLLNIDARRDLMAVSARLRAQRNIVVFVAVPTFIVYVLIAVWIILMTYWLTAIFVVLDTVVIFVFAATNLLFSSHGKGSSREENHAVLHASTRISMQGRNAVQGW
jgi:hypothetical protein